MQADPTTFETARARKRTGAGNAAELNILEEEARRIVEGSDGRARKPIGEADSGKRQLLHRVAGHKRKAVAVLIVVLNELRVDAHRLAK